MRFALAQRARAAFLVPSLRTVAGTSFHRAAAPIRPPRAPSSRSPSPLKRSASANKSRDPQVIEGR